MTDQMPGFAWRHLYWQQPLDPERVVGLLRQWAADQRSPRLVLETRSTTSGVSYLLGGPMPAVTQAARTMPQLLPGTTVLPNADPRSKASSASQIKASTRHRALRADNPLPTVRAILTALSQVRHGEELVVQVILGPRRVPLAIPTNSPSSIVAPIWDIIWNGNGGTIDSEKRRALRAKVSDHGFACTIRLGVVAATPVRRRALLLGLLAAVRTSETAGVQLRLIQTKASRLDRATTPWRWPLRLNVQELAGLLAWPLGDDLPGQPAIHPKQLPPAPGTGGERRVVARSAAPGSGALLALGSRDALHHLHVLGPTGTGKSTLLGNLICQDINDGRAVVVIEPKGDLVEDVLARIPDHRRGDVVLLDPVDDAPVGLNPLAGHGGRRELVADGLLAVFRQLYGAAIGPRSADILHAGLLTLARRSDASLVMLPLLLTNPGFRRSITSTITDPIALGPFWAAYEAWSEAERAAAIAPVMNKLRPLLRPNVRAVLGQRTPRFDIRQVFTERKILLVPLRRGLLGPEAASLIGSLVVAELWQASLGRTSLPAERRHPVMVYIDEVQDFLRLPTDIGDALAQARGLGVGFTLAHQFLGQLPTELKSGLLANARSRICFQLPHEDAVIMAKGHPELEPVDLTALGRYEVYASLFAQGQVTGYAIGRSLAPAAPTADVQALRRHSRDRYGQPLGEIENSFTTLLASNETDLGATGRRRRAP
jgi:hypothetical protein